MSPVFTEPLTIPPEVASRFAALVEKRREIDLGGQIYARDIEALIHEHLTPNTWIEKIYQVLCDGALAGLANEYHEGRETVLEMIRARIQLLDSVKNLARYAERITGRPLPETKQLEGEVESLNQKLATLASRWQTVEDLEDMAAESLAPSEDRLDAIMKKYPVPQEWYDETGKPF